jgi:fused signal recognition particle receptor
MVFNWFRRKFTDSADQPEQAESDHPETVETTDEASEGAHAGAEGAGGESEEAGESEVANADYLNWAKAAYQKIQERQGLSPAPPAPLRTDSVLLPIMGEGSQSVEEVIAASPTSEPPSIGGQGGDAAEPEPVVVEEVAQEVVEEAAVSEAVIETPEPEAAVPEPEIIAPEISEPESAPPSPPRIGGELDAEISTSASPDSESLSFTSDPPSIPSLGGQGGDAEPEPAIPLPFWAQSEAERQERLERIQAETPAPVEEPAPAPESVAATAAQPVQTPEHPPVQISEHPPDQISDQTLEMDEGFIWSAEVLAAQGRRPEDISLEEISWLQKLRQGLDKTRRGVVNQLKAVVGRGPLDQDGVTEIESLLLQADVGVSATDEIIESLQKKLRQEVASPTTALNYLKQILRDMLDRPHTTGGHSTNFAPDKEQLNIWLLTGVNGVGKTTTIGKLAHVAVGSGYKCLIGAADTFRAAAVEQVKVWGQRSNVEVISNPGKNTDPAAVVFDAISAAQSREAELLLVDTAGRLQNKQNLMEELRKIRRIIDKKAPGAKIESLLVLDATLGQNGLRQAQVFAEAAQLSGVIITKLDGSAKGGVALAVVQELGLPIRFIGAGEGIEDLRPFSSYEFVEALLSD